MDVVTVGSFVFVGCSFDLTFWMRRYPFARFAIWYPQGAIIAVHQGSRYDIKPYALSRLRTDGAALTLGFFIVLAQNGLGPSEHYFRRRYGLIDIDDADDIDIINVIDGGVTRIRSGEKGILVRILEFVIRAQLFSHFL